MSFESPISCNIDIKKLFRIACIRHIISTCRFQIYYGRVFVPVYILTVCWNVGFNWRFFNFKMPPPTEQHIGISWRLQIPFTEKTSLPFPFKLNGIWSWWQFSYRFSEPNGIPFSSKSKGKLSPRSYPVQFEREWKTCVQLLVTFIKFWWTVRL